MLVRPLTRPLVRPLTRRVTQPGFGWSPRVLFASGEQGAWYDPSDLSSMNTKHDGSGAVPGVGDPVGYIADKSGRGNHAKQTTDTARPTLQLASGRYYLQFDGVDDFLSTDNIDFTGTDKMTVVAGVLADIAASASIGMVVNHNGTGHKSFAMQAPTNTAGQVTYYALGASGGGGAASSGLPSPLLAILGGQVDLTGAITLRRNGALVGSATPAFVGGPFAAAVMAIGRQSDAATRHYKGNLYSLLIRGSLSTQAQIEAAERYANSKTGAY